MKAATVAVFAIAACLVAPGCTWVKLEESGKAVRVARIDESLAACEKAGEISVSVRDRVAFYDRDHIKVRDELETLARNEADSISADTIQSLGEPVAGEQRFAAYRCGNAPTPRTATRSPTTRPADDEGAAETFPLRDD